MSMVTPQKWRQQACACPDNAKPSERCTAKWTRCNERLAYLQPIWQAERERKTAKKITRT